MPQSSACHMAWLMNYLLGFVPEMQAYQTPVLEGSASVGACRVEDAREDTSNRLKK